MLDHVRNSCDQLCLHQWVRTVYLTRSSACKRAETTRNGNWWNMTGMYPRMTLSPNVTGTFWNPGTPRSNVQSSKPLQHRIVENTGWTFSKYRWSIGPAPSLLWLLIETSINKNTLVGIKTQESSKVCLLHLHIWHTINQTIFDSSKWTSQRRMYRDKYADDLWW